MEVLDVSRDLSSISRPVNPHIDIAEVIGSIPIAPTIVMSQVIVATSSMRPRPSLNQLEQLRKVVIASRARSGQ
jgi:hypothetical protein